MEVYSTKEPSKIITRGVLKIAPFCVIGNSQTYFQKIKAVSQYSTLGNNA